jgi:hypothetical protein
LQGEGENPYILLGEINVENTNLILERTDRIPHCDTQGSRSDEVTDLGRHIMHQVPREGRMPRRNIILYNLRPRSTRQFPHPTTLKAARRCRRTHLLKRLKHGDTPRITPHNLHLRKLRTKAHNRGVHLALDAGTEGCACPVFREMRKDARSMVYCRLGFLLQARLQRASVSMA